MKNNFDQDELHKWFVYNYDCWSCLILEEDLRKRNRPDCFHHILGRLNKYNNSILNAAPMNNFECHLPKHGKYRNKGIKIQLLKLTFEFLMKQGYELQENDKEFIRSNQSLYNEVLILKQQGS